MNLKHVLQGKFLPHPLHPFVVHLPIGMWIGSFVFDALALYRGSGSRGAFWNQISTTCMLLGCIGALPAAITGLAEYVDTPRGSQVRNIATTHAGLNVSLLAGYIGQLLMRRNINHTQVSHLALNFLHVGVLAISGMLGKKMVFQVPFPFFVFSLSLN